MPNYNEQTVNGVKWTRTARVIVETPPEATPVMTILEETAVKFDDQIHRQAAGQINVTFDAGQTFPLRHPMTDELIGATSSHEALQTLLYSVIRDAQIKRDEAAAANENPAG